VRYTTPAPSYAWNPRYYRIYQADTEGLWSAGSNVVYGNITNSSPSTPSIVYPVKDGDTMSTGFLSWNKCVDPNGNAVRYRVLINYYDTGYSQLANSLSDTFVQMPIFDSSVSFKYKVLAYDTLGDSSTWSEARLGFTLSLGDVDGNAYHWVRIGTQIWMVENLRTTKYNDGTPIPQITDPSLWSAANGPGYCEYSDSSSYVKTYGALYNWYAVNSGKLAPKGWHVPTDSDWTVLTTYLGGTSVAGGALKSTSTSWQTPNSGATNSAGFSAVPGGECDVSGTLGYFGYDGIWWSSTAIDSSNSWARYLYNNSTAVVAAGVNNNNGFSVRCLHNP
jgi:uncharacterized protein (TIGR02145 family)